MRMSRRLVVLALVAAGALVAGGCGGSDKPRSIKVVIAEYSKGHPRPCWQGLAQQYTEKTGTKVDLQVIDWNSIDQQVSTMIQNNQPPDVLNLNSFSSYAKDGLLYSGDEALSPKTREDFLEAFARGGTYRDKLYGFPLLARGARLPPPPPPPARPSSPGPASPPRRAPGTNSSRPRSGCRRWGAGRSATR